MKYTFLAEEENEEKHKRQPQDMERHEEGECA
jgi:hypothetical protein